ncbi:hypothetical protein KM043_003169 [Ampulex compressa]|nr:hypothetical protein KM043_003169 [Ampulex compressa]
MGRRLREVRAGGTNALANGDQLFGPGKSALTLGRRLVKYQADASMGASSPSSDSLTFVEKFRGRKASSASLLRIFDACQPVKKTKAPWWWRSRGRAAVTTLNSTINFRAVQLREADRSSPWIETEISMARKRRLSTILGMIILLLGLVNSLESEVSTSRSATTVPEISSIAVETSTSVFIEAEGKETQKSKVPYVSIASRNAPWRSERVSPKRDSYLEALRHSRTNEGPKQEIVKPQGPSGNKKSSIRREYIGSEEGPVYIPEREYGSPPSGASNSYSLATHPSSNTNGIDSTYNGPHSAYGPPHRPYGHQNSYGDLTISSYSQQAYGPPSYSYGAPHALPETPQISIFPSFDFSWPFALKLNAFTLAKILLKLVIFKMIVKFIAVICLLLFIPKLEMKKNNQNDMDDEEEGRQYLPKTHESSRSLDRLAHAVRTAHESYEALNRGRSDGTEDCASFGCRLRSALSVEQPWSDYLGLFKSYAMEERLMKKSEEASVDDASS